MKFIIFHFLNIFFVFQRLREEFDVEENDGANSTSGIRRWRIIGIISLTIVLALVAIKSTSLYGIDMFNIEKTGHLAIPLTKLLLNAS